MLIIRARWLGLIALAAAGRVQVPLRPCSPQDREASLRIVFPTQGAKLDIDTDLSVMRNLLVRTQIDGFKQKLVEGFQVVLNSRSSRRDQARRSADNVSGVFFTGLVGQPNFEIFGILEGYYSMWMRLVDFEGVSRHCWEEQVVRFRVVRDPLPQNREEALLKGLQKTTGEGRRDKLASRPWLAQPEKKGEFAYVTVLWSNDYVDCVLAWAAGLDAVRSTFRRVCAIAADTVSPNLVTSLAMCCCEIIEVEAVRSPDSVMKGEVSRYDLALTKLRVFQLGHHGLRKIVLMDSDTLVLENIDELFWFPAPAATVTKGALLGETSRPTLSTGVMVLEPKDEDFDAAMRYLSEWGAKAGEKEKLRFVEQDLLSMHWLVDGRPTYNVLPMTYNLYPELLDTFPFLDLRGRDGPSDVRKGPEAKSSPLGIGVKVVHLWHWYNPVLGVAAKLLMQIHAKTRHPLMWQWYERWWDLHQQGFRRIVTEAGYRDVLTHCRYSAERKHGAESAKRFVPIVGKGFGTLNCMHTEGLG